MKSKMVYYYLQTYKTVHKDCFTRINKTQTDGRADNEMQNHATRSVTYTTPLGAA